MAIWRDGTDVVVLMELLDDEGATDGEGKKAACWEEETNVER